MKNTIFINTYYQKIHKKCSTGTTFEKIYSARKQCYKIQWSRCPCYDINYEKEELRKSNAQGNSSYQIDNERKCMQYRT